MTDEPRGYAALLAGNIVSTFGSSIYVVTLVLYLAETTDSAAVLGLVQFLAYLPAALLGPAAGAIVDAWDRRRIIVWSDVARGAIMIATAAAGIAGTMPVWLLVVATMGVSVAGVVFVPAVHAIMPEIVDRRSLRRANGSRSAGTQIANLAGSAVGGALYVTLGAPLVILANGVSFLLSGAWETAIRPRTRPASEQRPSGRRGLRERAREGVRYLFADRTVRLVVVAQALVNLLLPPLVVALPFVISDTWKLGSEYFGYLFASVLAGGIAGFLALSRRGFSRTSDTVAYRSATAAITAAIAAIAALASPAGAQLAGLIPLLMAAMFVAGAAIGIMHMIGVTHLQQSVDSTMRGRVFAAMEMITAMLLPAAYVASGLLAEAMRASMHLLLGGVAAASLALTVFVVSRVSIAGGVTSGAPRRARRKW